MLFHGHTYACAIHACTHTCTHVCTHPPSPNITHLPLLAAPAVQISSGTLRTPTRKRPRHSLYSHQKCTYLRKIQTNIILMPQWVYKTKSVIKPSNDSIITHRSRLLRLAFHDELPTSQQTLSRTLFISELCTDLIRQSNGVKVAWKLSVKIAEQKAMRRPGLASYTVKTKVTSPTINTAQTGYPS